MVTDERPYHSRRQLEAGYHTPTTLHAMRIHYIWTPLADFRVRVPSSSSQVEMMVRVVRGAGNYFQNAIYVDSLLEIKIKGGSCGGTKVCNLQGLFDLVIILQPAPNEDVPYVVTSTSCFVSETTGRPVMASMWLNSKYMIDTPGDNLKAFGSVMHEMVHILGFNYDLFKYYKIPGTNTNRTLVAVIRSCYTRLMEYKDPCLKL